MNTHTKDELVRLLESLKEISHYLPYPYAAELIDNCKDLICALENDETITEPR